jgi:hypothetical protein
MKCEFQRTRAGRVAAPVIAIVAALVVGMSAAGSTASSASAQTLVANDDWDNATIVTGVPYRATENTTDATTAADEDSFWFKKTVWFSFTPTDDRVVAIHTGGSDYATDLFVYSGPRESRTNVDCYYIPSGGQQCALQAGDSYHIMVSARYGDGGNLVFSVDGIPQATLTINETGLFHPSDNPGAIRVSGTATCNVDMSLTIDAWFIQEPYSSLASGNVNCSSTTSSWSFDVPDWGYFVAGAGRVIVYGSGGTDAGGVYATADSPVTVTEVKTPQQLIGDLVALVQSYELGKLGTSLTDKLATVKRMLNAGKRSQAVENLDALVKQVNSQDGKGLTHEQASALTSAALKIRTAILSTP